MPAPSVEQSVPERALLSVVIPTYNEEANVPRVYERLNAVPDTTSCWPDAKHVPVTVIAAACAAAGASSAPTETTTAPAIAGRRRARRERVANEVRSSMPMPPSETMPRAGCDARQKMGRAA